MSSLPPEAFDSIRLRREFEGARFLIVPGHYDVFGGAERQATILAESLKQEYGCHVDFLAWGGSGPLAKEVTRIDCVPWVFELNQHQRGVVWVKTLLKLRRLIRDEIRPTYLLPFVGIHCKIVGQIWRSVGARFTWWNQRDEGREIYGTKRERKLLNTLPAVVSNSNAGRDFLVRKFGLPSERIRIINNGVRIPTDVSRAHWRSQLRMSDDGLLVLMVANLTKYKDHATLLHAFARVKQSEVGRRCKLVLAGRHGETTQMLKALAFDLNLSNCVSMPGHVEDIDSLVAASDLIVHSSRFEGCPNGVLEAMAHGRAVVGTDIPGMRQALGSALAESLLAPELNSERLAEIMISLLTDKTQREQVGNRNLARIRSDFSIPGMTASVLSTVLSCRVPSTAWLSRR